MEDRIREVNNDLSLIDRIKIEQLLRIRYSLALIGQSLAPEDGPVDGWDSEAKSAFASLDALTNGVIPLFLESSKSHYCDLIPYKDYRFAIEVMDMYFLMQSWNEGLPESEQIEPSTLWFDGFDSHSETHGTVFRLIVEHGSGFGSLRLHDGSTVNDRRKAEKYFDLNTAVMVEDVYERMLEAYRDQMKDFGPVPSTPFSADQIRAVLNARIHPEHRKTRE